MGMVACNFCALTIFKNNKSTQAPNDEEFLKLKHKTWPSLCKVPQVERCSNICVLDREAGFSHVRGTTVIIQMSYYKENLMTLLDKTITTYWEAWKYKNDTKKGKKRAAFQADIESVFLHLGAWGRCAVFSWQVCSSSEVIAPSGVHFGYTSMACDALVYQPVSECHSCGEPELWAGRNRSTTPAGNGKICNQICSVGSRGLFLNMRASYSVDLQENLLRFVEKFGAPYGQIHSWSEPLKVDVEITPHLTPLGPNGNRAWSANMMWGQNPAARPEIRWQTWNQTRRRPSS